jgi:hypothetical protein
MAQDACDSGLGIASCGRAMLARMPTPRPNSEMGWDRGEILFTLLELKLEPFFDFLNTKVAVAGRTSPV